MAKALEKVEKEKSHATGVTCEHQKCNYFTRGSRGMHMPTRKILKSGPVGLHSQHSGAKIRVFAQNTDIINLWLLGG